MSEADEQVIVEKLVSEIRPLAEKLRPVFISVGTQNKDLAQDQKEAFKQDWKHADELVNELNWLSGDPSTCAKVDVYLHPNTFWPFSVNLWIARNRRLVVAVYKQYGSKWDEDARGGMLAYMARYGEKGGLELLKHGIKLETGQPLNAPMALSQSFYSPTVNHFFEDELQREDDTQAITWAAGELYVHGTAKDQALIRARLNRWRKKWAVQGEKLDPDQGTVEAALILALIQGKNWQIDETETSKLKESCASRECRDRVKTFEDRPQTAP